MYKSDADEIAMSMKKLLEKRSGVTDWFKGLFTSEEGGLDQTAIHSRKLGYQEMLNQISSANKCHELPLITQWDKSMPPQIREKYGYDVELVGNLLKRQIEEKRQQLQQAGQCK